MENAKQHFLINKITFSCSVIQFYNISSSEIEPQATKVELESLSQAGKCGWALLCTVLNRVQRQQVDSILFIQSDTICYSFFIFLLKQNSNFCWSGLKEVKFSNISFSVFYLRLGRALSFLPRVDLKICNGIKIQQSWDQF